MAGSSKRDKIRVEAKEILDRFASVLEKVEIIKGKEIKSKSKGYREEGEGKKGDAEFRKKMFENAPQIEGDCIIAEKKKW